MEDWSDLFEPEALKKGYELFLNEAVEPFEVIDDGYGFREFEAEVEDGDEIFNVFNQDKHYVSILNAYAGRVQMYGEENISERFLYEYKDAKAGLVRTRSFFHELDDTIPVPDFTS
nr:hypothetical protein [uncultured Ruminococcus sp.]